MTTSMIYLTDDLESTVDRILADEELSGLGLTRVKVRRTLKSFSGDEIAASVFLKKYALRDTDGKVVETTLEEAKDRWAEAVAGAEKRNRKQWAERFRTLYDHFLPAGRQMFALNNGNVKKKTLTNCYVTKIADDSIEGIYGAAQNIAKTFSYGGGIGLCIGELRPRDAKVSNSALFSTGAVSFMDLFSLTSGLIGQSFRRGALMITIPVSHPDIEEFVEIKHGDSEKIKYANISIKLTDEFMQAVVDGRSFELAFDTKHGEIRKTVDARKLWRKIVISARDSAEPGLMFWDRMVKMSPSEIYEDLQVHSTNPCVTGETLVYVADGRGAVPIRDLAISGEDVPVFCVDERHKPVVRMMRHPRQTGSRMPVYKIVLDDGSFCRVTSNHKMMLTQGGEKAAKDLVAGDSLLSMTSFHAALRDVWKGGKSRSIYRWITVKGSTKAEHRLIAAFHGNKNRVGSGFVVHHRDHDGLNNSPDNLEVMPKLAHDLLHSQDMLGDKNPMCRAKTEWSEEKWASYKRKLSAATAGRANGRWDGVSNDELRRHALRLTKKLGRRFSHKEWRVYARKHGVTEQFSKWRNDHFGGLRGLAIWAAEEIGLQHNDLHPRTARHYKRLSEQGYECVVRGRQIFVVKQCEVCGQRFEVHHRRRESGICSTVCHSAYMADRCRNSEIGRRAIESMRRYWQNKKKQNGLRMVEVFLDLKQSLGRKPFKKELEAACKKQHFAHRVGARSFFTTYSDLKAFADDYNHRVVSVEFDGYEDVYNGTVDEFHNFAFGAWQGKTRSGKVKQSFIVGRQCGEQILEPGGACVLGSMLLHTFVKNPFTDEAEFDYDLFVNMVRGAVRHLDNVVTLNMGNHALLEQEQAAINGRRIGLGLTGLADMLAALNLRYDSVEALALVEKIMICKRDAEYSASMNLAAERGSFKMFDPERHYTRGFPSTLPETLKALGRNQGQRNVAISTIAPSGSLSIIAQCSSGIEPIFALRYKRYVELGDERKEFEVCHQGLARFMKAMGTKELPSYWVTAHQIPPQARIRMQAMLQKYIDASISSTINLPENVAVDTVADIYMEAWKAGLKGVTVYREGSREGILITDDYAKKAGRPMIDTVVHNVRAEGGDKFYIPVSYRGGDLRQPYQVFIMNYKAAENDRLVKLGNDLVRMVRAKGVSEERIAKYLARSANSLSKVTRFISLALKADLLAECVDILDRHAFAGTLAAALHDIFARSLAIGKLLCKECGSHNVRHEEGCKRCLDCGWTGCG